MIVSATNTYKLPMSTTIKLSTEIMELQRCPQHALIHVTHMPPIVEVIATSTCLRHCGETSTPTRHIHCHSTHSQPCTKSFHQHVCNKRWLMVYAILGFEAVCWFMTVVRVEMLVCLLIWYHSNYIYLFYKCRLSNIKKYQLYN